MNEATIRSALTGGEAVVSGEDIGRVVIEDVWAAVVLARDEEGTRDLLRRCYERLRGSFPSISFEVRAGTRVFRGGAGFGEGRHVVAVLGGKGGVGTWGSRRCR